ncbi:MAG: amidohydrolase [Longimonas sp.]|uniref:amidohydrolase n=1 Tax=Longimonas sp. TaxID=2039626 RepID=UPI00335164E5
MHKKLSALSGGLLGLFACTALLLLFLPTAAQAQADRVVHNATIYTMTSAHPTVEAMAIRGERVLMVGTNEQVRGAYPDAPTLDAEGRAIVPGLIDAHGHLTGLAETFLQADLVSAGSVPEVIERLEAFADDLPEGAWLEGRGWDQNEWPGEGDFPTRQDLDEAFPDRPVYLVRIDGHAAWVNTAALEAAGFDAIAAMDDPEGGAIRRDAEGMPTGILIDTAMQPVRAEIPSPTSAQLDDALDEALATTARLGLTGVHDAGISRASIERYQRFIDADRFPLRVHAMVDGRGETFDHYCADGLIHDYEGRLSVRSVKFYMDGALGSRGAALLHDYSDDPGNDGLLMRSPEGLEDDVRTALRCGYQVNTHAIGDRGNREVLNAYALAQEAQGTGPGRHRIEHAQVLDPEDMGRFVELGIIASMQPMHATSDMGWAEDRLGADRVQGAYAWQSLKERGVRLAFGSDFPVEPVDPLQGFHAAVTRQDSSHEPEGGWQPLERMARFQALRGFTHGAAYAAFNEDDRGQLAPGYYADFVILSDDIMRIPETEILDAEVIATYLGGAPIYERDE